MLLFNDLFGKKKSCEICPTKTSSCNLYSHEMENPNVWPEASFLFNFNCLLLIVQKTSSFCFSQTFNNR